MPLPGVASEARGPAGRGSSAVLTLAATLLGFLVVPMAMTGTSVALPRIAADLGGSAGSLQWVVTGYFLAASCLMLVAGSLGGRFGRRRVFRIGAAVYAAATFASAVVQDVLLLDVARTFAGAGAAGVMAGGSVIVASTFEGPGRTRAFAAVGTTLGVGTAFGPTLSGWLVTTFGWRAMFATFAIAGLGVLLGTLFMQESAPAARPRVDLLGALVFVLGMVGLIYGADQVAQVGWGSPTVLGCVAAGLLMLAGFVLVERSADHPVLDLALLRNRPFLGWLLAAVTMTSGSISVLVYLPVYLQGAGGLPAREAGTIMLAATLPILAVPPLAGRLVNRGLPARRVIVSALTLLVAGNAWLTVPDASSGIAALLGPLLLIGVGAGLAAGLSDAQAMDQVAPDRIGMASGLLNSARGGANAVMLALFGAALVSLIQARVGERELAGRVAAGDLTGGDRSFLIAQYTSAWHIVLWIMAGVCAVSGVVVHRLLSAPRSQPEPTTAPGSTTERLPTDLVPTSFVRTTDSVPTTDLVSTREKESSDVA